MSPVAALIRPGISRRASISSVATRPPTTALATCASFVVTEPLGPCVAELLDQCGQARQIARLHKLPGALAEFVDRRQGIRVDIDAFLYQKRIVADFVKHMMMLRQRRQDQRQARWLRVVLQDRAVDGAEEAFRVDVHLRLFPAVAVMHGRVPATYTSV
jgi:hypothetical protein